MGRQAFRHAVPGRGFLPSGQELECLDAKLLRERSVPRDGRDGGRVPQPVARRQYASGQGGRRVRRDLQRGESGQRRRDGNVVDRARSLEDDRRLRVLEEASDARVGLPAPHEQDPHVHVRRGRLSGRRSGELIQVRVARASSEPHPRGRVAGSGPRHLSRRAAPPVGRPCPAASRPRASRPRARRRTAPAAPGRAGTRRCLRPQGHAARPPGRAPPGRALRSPRRASAPGAGSGHPARCVPRCRVPQMAWRRARRASDSSAALPSALKPSGPRCASAKWASCRTR